MEPTQTTPLKRCWLCDTHKPLTEFYENTSRCKACGPAYKKRPNLGCRRGEANPGAKLTEAQVLEIRRLYKTKQVKEIAAQFGMSKGAIYGIVTRKNWWYLP